MALHNERAGIDERQIVPAGGGHGTRAVGRGLPDGHRLPGEQGLVHGHVGGREEDGVSRNAVSRLEQEEIIADHLAPRDASLLPVADDEGARTREVPQPVERALRLVLLIHRDAGDQDNEAEEHEGFLRIAEDDVDRPTGDEEDKHRLAEQVERRS